MTSNSTTRPVPGEQPLPRGFILRHQRARIIAALAEEASDKGFQAVTVADIVKRAGVGRSTFYENFRSKEDCFLAAHEQAMTTALERVVEAGAAYEDWPRRVKAGLTAFLDYVVEEPALARTCMVEVLTAGPASVKRYEESQHAFVSLFRVGRDVSPHDLPETLEEAIIGGVFWIVFQRLSASTAEAGSILDLLPEMVEFTLTPYLGVEAARKVAAARDVEGPRGGPSGEGADLKKLAS